MSYTLAISRTSLVTQFWDPTITMNLNTRYIPEFWDISITVPHILIMDSRLSIQPNVPVNAMGIADTV